MACNIIKSPLYIFQYSYDIPNLTPGIEYEAQVQAMNKFGWSQRSEAVRFTAGLVRGSEDSNAQHGEYGAWLPDGKI